MSRKVYYVSPKYDFEVEPHTWFKTEKYRVVEDKNIIKVNSEEGRIIMPRSNRNLFLDHFEAVN